jgi:uncharacterized protein YcfJ
MIKNTILNLIKKTFFSGIVIGSSLYAGGDRFYDYARVTYSEPIYEYVYEKIPNRVCEEVKYKVRDNYDDQYYSSGYDDSLGIDTLVGTAAGAVLGSQIGKGNGRVAAQIVGGLLGAKVAHEIRNYKPRAYNKAYRYETRTECYDEPKRVEKKMITGYKNYFVYNGVKHFKTTDRPINRVRINHTIEF